jgi:anthranilate phosphoribosyltransferase
VWVVRGGVATSSLLDPRELGFARAEPAALRGGSAADNARTARTVLDGRHGPVRDVVLLNAAAVLVATTESDAPLTEQFATAIADCTEAIDTGAARATLYRWVATSRRVASSPCHRTR